MNLLKELAFYPEKSSLALDMIGSHPVLDTYLDFLCAFPQPSLIHEVMFMAGEIAYLETMDYNAVQEARDSAYWNMVGDIQRACKAIDDW